MDTVTIKTEGADVKLADWRRSQGMTQEHLGHALDCIVTTIARYETGLRRPEPGMMQKIFILTNGAVQPNDFYDLPDLRAFARPPSHSAPADQRKAA